MGTSPQSRRRVIWALVASTLVHLLLLAAYLRMADWYRRQELRPTRYLPDLLLMAPDLFLQRPMGRIPERLMERKQVPAKPGESVPLPFIDPDPESLTTEAPPALADSLQPRGRLPVFLSQPDLADYSLNERDIEAVGQLRDQYDGYARYWTPDADPTDAESAARTKAEAIVVRAFEAMGGLDKLLKITEMRMVVWVVASESVWGEGRAARIDRVPPYPYPIATWRMHGLDRFERDVFRVDFDLGSGEVFPSYVTKNPAHTRRAYYRLFDARWRIFAPGTTSRLRLQSEGARWHFCDWFLGEGIRLGYAGVGRLESWELRNPRVDLVQVDDRKFGRQFEAFFARDSGLLLAMREGLSGAEARWYKQKHNLPSPTWMTHYDDYREVGDVLLPHQWSRAASSTERQIPGSPGRPQRVTLHLNIAVNGAAPDTVAPELQ